MIIRLRGVLLLFGISAGLAEENEPSALEQHGHALAERIVLGMSRDRGKSGRAPMPGRLPFARSIGDWSSILSSTDCAKGSWLVIPICRHSGSAAKMPAASCYI